MTDQEKLVAFDNLTTAFINRWYDGSWTWWNPTPCGGLKKQTREEAVADLIQWAEQQAKRTRERLKL